MSWENVSGQFQQYKGSGIRVCEVQIRKTPEHWEDHAEHVDDYYFVGDSIPTDINELLEAVGITDEHYGMKVITCEPRSSTLTITDGTAVLEPDFFGSSEDTYWFNDKGELYDPEDY